MTAATLDASVVAAAFFREPHSELAARLITSGAKLHAPDLLYAEVGNVVWKRHGRGELSDEDAVELVGDLLNLPLQVTPAVELVGDALRLALRLKRTVYDCIYLALAVRTGAALVSGDRRLVNALSATPIRPHVAYLGNVRLPTQP